MSEFTFLPNNVLLLFYPQTYSCAVRISQPNSMFCLLEQKIIVYSSNMSVEWKCLLLSQNGHVGRSEDHYCNTFCNSIKLLLKDNVKIKKVIKHYFTDTTTKTICNLLVLNIMFKMLKNDRNYTSMFDKLTSYNNNDGKYSHTVRL